MWGPQQTRRDTCRPLRAWSFVGQLRLCKWALPAHRHWGAHFMVSPLTAVAHSPLLECAPRAWGQAMQWAQLQLWPACYVVISVVSQRTVCVCVCVVPFLPGLPGWTCMATLAASGRVAPHYSRPSVQARGASLYCPSTSAICT